MRTTSTTVQPLPIWPELLCMLACVALARAVSIYCFHIFDDSFITFRYSANFVAGQGLVYNLGERVQGITAPLYGLLLALPHALGLSIEWSSRILGLMSELIVAILALHLFFRENLKWGGIIVVFLFAIDPYLAKTAVGGMESSLMLLGTVAATALALHRRAVPAAIVTAFCYFIRPEMLLFAMALMVYIWREEGQFPWRAFLYGAAILLVGVAIQYAYYGDLIPQSVRGKAAYHKSFRWIFDMVVLPKKDPIQSVLTVTTLLGLPWAWRRSNFVRLYGLWAIPLSAVWLATRAFLWPWYCVPVFFYKCAVTGVALHILVEKFPRTEWLRRIGKPAVLLTMTLIFWSAIGCTTGRDPIEKYIYAKIRQWSRAENLKAHTAFSLDFGALGFYTRMRILDAPGLVRPESLYKYGRSAKRILLEEKPEWAYITCVKDQMDVMMLPEIAALYRPVWRASIRGDSTLFPDSAAIPSSWSHDFILYRRTDIPQQESG